jgi:hypothetical protein
VSVLSSDGDPNQLSTPLRLCYYTELFCSDVSVKDAVFIFSVADFGSDSNPSYSVFRVEEKNGWISTPRHQSLSRLSNMVFVIKRNHR